MRLIDGDELLEHAYRDRLDTRERIADMIRHSPTIDYVAQKVPISAKGKWKRSQQILDITLYKCSLCGTEVPVQSKYCPDCGADMREVEE